MKITVNNQMIKKITNNQIFKKFWRSNLNQSLQQGVPTSKLSIIEAKVRSERRGREKGRWRRRRRGGPQEDRRKKNEEGGAETRIDGEEGKKEREQMNWWIMGEGEIGWWKEVTNLFFYSFARKVNYLILLTVYRETEIFWRTRLEQNC